MSIVIIGGNECMTRKYTEICELYSCKARVYPKMCSSMKNIGTPDLLVLFTNTVSHKMIRCALSDIKGKEVKIARCHSSSVTALRGILEEHIGRESA